MSTHLGALLNWKTCKLNTTCSKTVWLKGQTCTNCKPASRAAGDAESLSVSPVLLAAVQSAGTAVRHVVHSPPVKTFFVFFFKK